MITTTKYIQVLTITTDDDGAQTISRNSYADTETEYRFTELSPEAQARAIRDAIEEEHDYYQYGIYGTSQSGISESEIWDAAETLAKHQPVHIGTDAGGSPYGTARRYSWSAADWETWTHDKNADTATDNGAEDIARAERRRAAAYEDIAERIEDAAEELTEDAARAVGNVIDGLIEAERDYYQSPEFWREWYTNGDERFTRDGERI